MGYRARAYPYPVLSPFSDDFGRDSDFSASTTVEIDESDTQLATLNVRILQTSSWLAEYIMDGKAHFMLDIDCRATLVRKFVTMDTHSASIEIGRGQLYGPVRVTPLIVARESNDAYRPEGVNAEFGTQGFSVKVNDILAIGSTEVFELEFVRTLDRDLVTIQYSPEPDAMGIYKFEFSGQRIVIVAGEDLREPIGQMRASSATKPYLYMSIFKDCLASALEFMAEEPTDSLLELAWARSLQERLDEVGRELQPNNREYQQISAQLLVAKHGFKKLELTNV